MRSLDRAQHYKTDGYAYRNMTIEHGGIGKPEEDEMFFRKVDAFAVEDGTVLERCATKTYTRQTSSSWAVYIFRPASLCCRLSSIVALAESCWQIWAHAMSVVDVIRAGDQTVD